MIPISGLRARAPFPYVGLATAVLLHAILVAIVPPNPYRAVFALAALFAVGYCTLALIVGSTIRLSGPEILAFSTGLTIFITSLSALGVSILGIPITVFAVVIVGLPIALFALFVQRPRGNPVAAFTDFTRGVLDFSEYSAVEKGAAAVMFAGIAAALVIFVSLFFLSSRGRHTRCSRDWSSDVCSSDLNRASRSDTGHSAASRAPSDPAEWKGLLSRASRRRGCPTAGSGLPGLRLGSPDRRSPVMRGEDSPGPAARSTRMVRPLMATLLSSTRWSCWANPLRATASSLQTCRGRRGSACPPRR